MSIVKNKISRQSAPFGGRVTYDTSALNGLPMLEVVKRLNHTVRKSGKNDVMLCPFHEDHHPSMVIYEHHTQCFACGKTVNVIGFVMEDSNKTFLEACDWLSQQFGTGRVEETSPMATRTARRTHVARRLSVRKHPSMEQSFHGDWTFSAEYVASHVSMQDSFCKCLQHVFDKEKVRYVAEMYGIGCFGIDDTMFPVMDADLNVHNIKIQHYDTNPLSSGFFHKDHGKAWWYGKKYMETHPDKGDTFCDVQCYFGEHLISRYPSAIIVLVESPKNAILGTCLWPQYLWVAAGNKNMLTRPRLQCLRGRSVIVMPDADAEQEWRTILDGMRDIATFVFSSMIPSFRDMGSKCDIGDWVVERMRN